MTIKLNLLPEDYVLTGPAQQAVKLVRPLNVILLAFFLVAALGMGAYFVYSSITLGSLTTQNNNLENQIQAQENSQQTLVLLKDRAAKIQTVQKIANSKANLTGVIPLISNLPSDTSISELDIDSQKVTASLIFKSSTSLSSFLSSLNSKLPFKSVIMSSLGYNPSGGYLLGLELDSK